MNAKLSKTALTSAFIIGWLALASCLYLFGWSNTWNSLGLPSMSPAFADLRTVQGSLESIQGGFSPQIKNPGDPWARSMNYPSVWIEIAKVAHLQSEINYLAFVSGMIALYIYCCYRIFSLDPSPWALLLIFSGAPLLTIERGNNDLLIFSLLYFSTITPAVANVVLIFTATALKIYPALASVLLIHNLKIFMAFVSACLILLYAMRDELSLIRDATPAVYYLSYGSMSFAALIKTKFGIDIHHGLITAALIFAAIATTFLRQVAVPNFSVENDTRSRLFIVGTVIYLGSFMLGSNWDYRLLFLIFCLPLIFSLADKYLKLFLLICMLLADNFLILHAIAGPAGGAVNVLSKCFLFIGLMALALDIARAQLTENHLWSQYKFFSILKKKAR